MRDDAKTEAKADRHGDLSEMEQMGTDRHEAQNLEEFKASCRSVPFWPLALGSPCLSLTNSPDYLLSLRQKRAFLNKKENGYNCLRLLPSYRHFKTVTYTYTILKLGDQKARSTS